MIPKMWIPLLISIGLWNISVQGQVDQDDSSRKILGSSVVTSVSVIMDPENGTGASFSDAVGKPVAKPPVSKLASPIELLNPDRYEFYTFDESGDLVKRLMTLQEIKAIIATSGDDVFDIDNLDIMPEKRVNDIVSNVQNVLREEMEAHKLPDTNHLFDTPDVSDTWSMILPAIFGNSGDDIKPERVATGSTPETILLQPTQTEPTTKKLPVSSTTSKPPSEQVKTNIPTSFVSSTTGRPTTKPASSSTERYTTRDTVTQSYSPSTKEATTIRVQIFPNSNTNHLEEPYSKFATGGTSSNFDYITTRTPKPDLPLESRISSLVLENTSPIFNPERRTSPSNPLSVETTESSRPTILSSVSSLTTLEKAVSSSVSTSSLPPKTTTSKPTSTKQTTEFVKKTTVKPITQQTEKIYILVRPLSSSTTQEPTKLVNTIENRFITTSKPNQGSSQTNQAIFKVSSEKPMITVASRPQATTTKDKVSSTIPSTTSRTEDDDRRSTLPISEFLSYFTPTGLTSTSSKTNTTLPTLAQILGNDANASVSISTPSNYKISTEYPPFSTSQSVTSEQKQITATRDESSNTFTSNDFSSYPTNPETTFSTTQAYFNEEPTTEKLQSETNDNRDTSQNILQQLLLSSTNVYEINSAINEAVTDSFESTIPADFTSTLPQQNFEPSAENNQTLLESFSHLLAQAVNNVNGVIIEDNATLSRLTTDPDLRTTSLFTDSFRTTTDNVEDTEPISLSTVTETPTYETEATSKMSSLSTAPGPSNFTPFGKRNSSKPAKADLSLEVDYDSLNFNHTEMDKLIQDKFNQPQDSQTTTKGASSINQTPPTTTEAVTPLDIEGAKSTTEDDLYTPTNNMETTYPTKFTENLQEIQTTPTFTKLETTADSASSISTPTAQSEDKTPSWTLVSTIAPHSKVPTAENKPSVASFLEPTPTVDLSVQPMQGFGLEESTSHLEYDIYQFIQLCNELAFGFWKSVTTGISSARSVIVSPFAATSLLAMVFLGARGATSGEMNEILKLDNMVTFNPHLIFKTITESIGTGADTGLATSALVRQLYSDRSREAILNFYKERARFFYDGHVEEVSFKDIGDTIRRRTNLLVKKQTNGKLQEFLKDGSVRVRSPLAAVSASVMQTDCTKGSISDRDGELHFVVFPSLKQRRLIPIPAVVYRKGFLAGYEPSLDATAVALGDKDDNLSFIFVLPGKQGINAAGDGLARLEKRLVESSFQKGAWSRLLRTLVPRPGLEIQIPRFSHRSIINATSALKQMGLKTLFDINKADLRGLNGVAHDLYLSDMLQFNYFSVCGSTVSNQHSEYYPATSRRSLRKHRRLDRFEQQRILHDDPLFIIDYLSLPLNLRPRQARVPQVPRLRLDRPFLYFVRHNPTGLILHMGRFNPRLLP